MKSVYAGTTTQKEANEDVFGYSARGGWVLDGATGSGNFLSDSHSDAQWFAQRISIHLSELTTNREAGLRNDIFLAVTRTSEEFRKALGHHEGNIISPSVALAAFKARDSYGGTILEICLVGDCNASVQHRGEWNIYSDDRIKAFEEPLAKAISEYVRAGRGDYVQARDHYEDWFQKNRDRRNRDYAVACEGLALDDILSFELLLAGDTRIVLSTDGAYRLVDVFQRFTPKEFASFAIEHGVQKVLDASAEAESEDPEILSYPRTKPWDDNTILIAEF